VPALAVRGVRVRDEWMQRRDVRLPSHRDPGPEYRSEVVSNGRNLLVIGLPATGWLIVTGGIRIAPYDWPGPLRLVGMEAPPLFGALRPCWNRSHVGNKRTSRFPP
jgi:hypothetical protein